jgi:RimJ/RimL family protein N-acetyltransferase
MLETARLLIRPILPEDNGPVYRYRSDAATNQFQSWVPASIADVDTFIAKNPVQFNQVGTWYQVVLVEKPNGEVIGDIGIHFKAPENQQCELGCTLAKAYQGKGFATEALVAVIDHLFENLHKHRIVTSIDPSNIPSLQLVERLGFRKEGYFRESLWLDGKWVDDVVYAMLRREWPSIKSSLKSKY